MRNRQRRGYVLVYHARPDLPGAALHDKTNDPELRIEPVTWGICRTNVRGWVDRGDDLFFVALAESSYLLTAHFRVGELIGHDEARRRFGQRQNVIVDLLPPGESLQSRLRGYVIAHRSELKWQGGQRIGQLAEAGDPLPGEHTVEFGGTVLVHSFWDAHTDWQKRLRTHYVVADPAATHLLERPVEWKLVRDAVAGLPESLRINNPQTPHTPKRLSGSQLEFLGQFVASMRLKELKTNL